MAVAAVRFRRVSARFLVISSAINSSTEVAPTRIGSRLVGIAHRDVRIELVPHSVENWTWRDRSDADEASAWTGILIPGWLPPAGNGDLSLTSVWARSVR